MDEEIFYIVSVCSANEHGKMVHPLTLTGKAQPGVGELTSQQVYTAVMNEVTRCYWDYYLIPQKTNKLIVLNYHVVQNRPQVKSGPLGIVR